MAFCKVCGQKLEDGAQFCPKCGSAVGGQRQPMPQNRGAAQRPAGQSEYAIVRQPVDNAFVKALKNIPVVFISYFVNRKAVLAKLKSNRDFLLSAMYTVILFFAFIIYGCCFYAGLGNTKIMGYEIFGMIEVFNFGVILLHSLLMIVLLAVFYIGVRFALVKIFCKEKPAQEAFFDSVVVFGINSIPVICVILVLSLFTLLTVYAFVAVLLFACIYYGVTIAVDVKNEAGKINNEGLYVVLTSVFLAVAAFVFTVVTWNLFKGYITDAIADTARGAVSGMSSLSSLGNLF